MAKSDNLKDLLTDVADAIREKKGTTAKINPQDFASEIASIESGGTSVPDMPIIGDGKTYLYINISAEGRMTVPLHFSQTIANGVTIDWGDGSPIQTLDGTGNRNTTHTYSEVGTYCIILNPSGNCILGLGSSSSANSVMGTTAKQNIAYCNMLKAVELGNNVQSIYNYAFHNCRSLASILIPEGITSIGNKAFYNCYSLTSALIPEGVTSIGNEAFRSCFSLANVSIPQSVIGIGTSAFSDCTSLTSVVLPEGIVNIANNTFQYCRSLASISIPDSVTKIGASAFSDCYSIECIDIPKGVTGIGNSAFNNCGSLTSVVLPKGTTSIGTYTFSNCYSLTSILISERVKTIGNNAFSNCTCAAFYDFSMSKSVPALGGASVFTNSPSDVKIIVPDTLYDDWIATTNWSTYASKVVKASEFNS